MAPEKVLCEFVNDKANTFLAVSKLLSKFESVDRSRGAKEVVQRLNTLFCGISGFDKSVKRESKERSTFLNFPLVWDTGASCGLTLFCTDFIGYVECSIPVKDITRSNMVIGIGATLHKFECQGKLIYLSCLFYHLPSAEIFLFSPQTYHTLYGGHSIVFDDWVVMMINHLSIEIPINGEAGNVPMIYNSSCSAAEVKKSGILIRPALPPHERKVAMMGSSVSNNFTN